MATSPQAGLDPARSDDRRSLLGTLELGASCGVELLEVGRAEVGQCMALEPGPQVLDGIEFRRVRRQERHLNVRAGGVQVLAHELG